MKFKDLLIPLALSLATVWGIQHFISRNAHKNDSQPRPGQSFTALTQEEIKQQIAQPLLTSVDFAPSGQGAHAQTATSETNVTTSYGVARFTSRAGVLENLSFKRILSGKERVLTPIAALEGSSERAAFVVALDSQTPHAYMLTDKQESAESTRLTYRGEGPTATIIKEFTLYNEVPRIDIRLTVEPHDKTGPGVRARMFVPAPLVSDADQDYVPMGLVYTDRQRLQKQKFGQLAHQFWFAPSLLGAEDRYFINAMIGDPDGFTRRGYYTGTTPATLSFILEGPTIKEAKAWNLSFYCGPKDAHLMEKVDKRLDSALDYGWLSPLVKILLSALKFLYRYLKNYGWAIIVLTLLMRLLLLPVTFKSSKMAEKQKEFQRKMQYIEQKYKNDTDALNRERMELTRKYGMSNVLGCLPQLAQLPILLALNRLLSTSVELYQAPFVGWITDLSARDPYYILPILAGVGLFIQVTTDGDTRRGVTMLLFAALLVAFTAHLSAGLTLYLCANTWLSIAQVALQKAFKI